MLRIGHIIGNAGGRDVLERQPGNAEALQIGDRIGIQSAHASAPNAAAEFRHEARITAATICDTAFDMAVAPA